MNTAIEGAAPIAPARAAARSADSDEARAKRRRELRKFGVLVGGVFLLIAFRILWKHHFAERTPLFYCLGGGGGALFLLGLALPATLAPVQRGWMKLAHVLGWINTRVLLSVLFFVPFTAVGLILRVVGRDPLARRLERDRKSYWIDRPDAPVDRERYKKPF